MMGKEEGYYHWVCDGCNKQVESHLCTAHTDEHGVCFMVTCNKCEHEHDDTCCVGVTGVCNCDDGEWEDDHTV